MIKNIVIGIIALLIAIPVLSLFNRKFYEVEASIVIDSRPDNVWKILAVEFGNIYKYTENVEHSKYLGDQTAGIGTQRLCDLKGGGFMKEEITHWEEEEQLTIRILDASMPAEPGTNLQFILEPLNENQTSLTAIGSYRLKYIGMLSPLLGKSAFQKLVEGLLEIAKINAEQLNENLKSNS